MKLSGPYLTLVGGLAVGGVLLALSTNAVSNDKKDDTVTASGASTTAATSKAKETTAKAAAKAEKVPPGTYAGEVNGGGASIAIAVKGSGTAIAYVCDGKKAEAWVQGKGFTVGTPLKLTGEEGSATAKYSKGTLSGTVSASGLTWTFKVKAVKSPSGLYRSAANVRKAKVVAGWIVYNGKQVGVVSSSTAGEIPAPLLDVTTGTATIDGVSVQATAVDGSPID